MKIIAKIETLLREERLKFLGKQVKTPYSEKEFIEMIGNAENDDKEGNISHAVNNAWSLERLTSEMSKCEVRCANCHRIKTIERRNQLFINQTKTT
jgi:hypothetical protein